MIVGGAIGGVAADRTRPATEVPCVIVDVDDGETTVLSLVDNTVREPLRKGEIQMRTALALLPLKADPKAQRKLMQRILKEELSFGGLGSARWR